MVEATRWRVSRLLPGRRTLRTFVALTSRFVPLELRSGTTRLAGAALLATHLRLTLLA